MERKDDSSAKKRVNISITETSHELLKKHASRKNKTVSQMVEDWIWDEEMLEGQVRLDRGWVKELDVESLERLLTYCYENHTSPSEAVKRWIWSAKVKGNAIRGQMSFAT